MNNFSFPANYTFKNHYLQQFAEQFSPFLLPFWHGGIFSEESAEWNNVFDHCLSEALTVDILVEAINAKKGDQALDRELLTAAALLHDAYKRREIEKVKSQPTNLALLYETDIESKEWLKSLDVKQGIIELQDGIGNNAAKNIYFGEITDLAKRLLHYVDDITQGDTVVSLEERLAALEENPKYREQNEWSKHIFEGLTLYQAKRKISAATEQEISEVLGLADHGRLPAWINEKTEGRFLSSS